MKTTTRLLSTLLALALSTPLLCHAAPKAKTASKPASKTVAKPAQKTVAAKPAISFTDPQRWTKVKEWNGVLSTKAESGGQRDEAGGGRTTYNSSVTVSGRFKLAPHYDNRNVDPFSLRGKGEALVQVSGKRKTQYKEEVVTTTWVGDYIDTFNVEISNFDLDKGTYQMSVILDLWQKQPHEGKAIHYREVIVRRFSTSVQEGMAPGHPWANDAGAGFGRNSPLPKSGFVINGSMTSNNDDFLSDNGSKWHTNWTIRPAGPEYEEPLKAVAGTYNAERGQSLTLDGFRSTGKIQSYKWKFEPADAQSEIPFNAGAAKDGRRITGVFLAPVKATLTVSDGKKEDSDTVVIKIAARDYQTPFVHREGEEQHPRSIPPRMIKGRDLKYAGGENVCALDDYNAKDSVHILHPAPAGGSWETRGYNLKQVQDPNGPFDGVWYVDSYSVQIERKVLINKYIVPKGPPPVRTAKRFYDANKELGNDVDGYLEAVRKHELLHTQLMQEALKTNDPGPKLEALASKEKDALKVLADKEIQSSETAIDKASQDPLPTVGWKGKIAFPDDATDKYISMEMEI